MILELEQVTKTYRNGVQALKGINLSVAEGDFFALLGPNGAGKSTTIGILTSLVLKNSGKVTINGYDLDKQLSQAKSQIGVVPQEFNFNSFEKVTQIIVNQAGYYGVPRKIAKQRCEKYLKLLGLWEKRDAQSRMLSGGMKRRLMIARALVHEPKILVLDEPTAGVDIELRRSMWEFLTELNRQGTTIILTTHYLEEAEQLCRNLAIINHGEVVEQGSVSGLLNKLKCETFILYPQEPIAELPADFPYELIFNEEGELEITISENDLIADALAEFRNRGLKIRSLRNKSNRLEELFLRLTAD